MDTSVPSLPETLAAVDTLYRSGISDEVVGRVMREWLSKNPAQPDTRRVLAPPTELAPAPDSVNLSVRPTASATFTGSATKKVGTVEKDIVPIKVRYPDGSATNISVSRSLFVQLSASCGSDKAAREKARALALTAPADAKNRSGWVSAELSKYLVAAAK